MARKVMIGNSSYVPKSRKNHEKHLLVNGPFHDAKLYMSMNSPFTIVFTVNGETGRYVGKTKLETVSMSETIWKVYDRDCDKDYWLPRLYWKEIKLEKRND